MNPHHDVNPRHIVAGTGHRPQYMSVEQQTWLRGNLDLCVRWLHRHRQTRVVISGMALGFDLWLAAAAVRAGLELWAYIPFPQQADRWTPADRAEWQRLRGLATREVIIDSSYSVSALHRRNTAMIRDSGAVVAGWMSNVQRGGTYEALVTAVKLGRPGVHLDPADMAVRFTLPTLETRPGDTKPRLVVPKPGYE